MIGRFRFMSLAFLSCSLSDLDDKDNKTIQPLITTDVLGYNKTDNQNGETSTTHVRVTNPYFVMGQDDFQRNVKEDDRTIKKLLELHKTAIFTPKLKPSGKP